MQGHTSFQYPLFFFIEYSTLIPETHLLRKVDNALDLSFIKALTYPFYVHGHGRPSIDPELFVRMLFIGYLYKIHSDRQLCEEIWFCHLSLEAQCLIRKVVFDRAKDRFICPHGKYLLPYGKLYKDRKTYRLSLKECVNCPYEKQCCLIKSTHKRVIHKSVYQDLYEQVDRHMKSREFSQALSERMWKMEGIIAEAKVHHGLDKAKYRSLKKIQIQAYLTATAQNIKRLIKAI